MQAFLHTALPAVGSVGHEVLSLPDRQSLVGIIFLYSAFGSLSLPETDQSNSSMWVPQFAETLLVEVYANGTVSFLRGLPNESFGSGFAFSFTPLRVGCGSSGKIFSSSCSLDDVEAYLTMNAAPTSRDITEGTVTSECWLPNEFQRLCNSADTTPSSLCYAYRMSCHQACAFSIKPKSVLDLVTGTCWSFVPDTFDDHASPAVGAACGALVAGIVIGRLIRWIVDYEDRVHPDDEGYLESEKGEDPSRTSSTSSDSENLNGEGDSCGDNACRLRN